MSDCESTASPVAAAPFRRILCMRKGENYCAPVAMIEIARDIRVPEDALSIKFVRASGPGGQHVNKVATAVELRLDLARVNLPTGIRVRLQRIAGRRLNSAGEIVIFAQNHRSQARNRDDAFARLRSLVTSATHAPAKRIPTKPSRAARERRRESKRRRSSIKRARRRPDIDT